MISIKDNEKELQVAVDIKNEGTALPEFINQLNIEINKQGRVITNFKLNNVLCDLADLSSEIIITNKDSIEIFSDSPLHIAKTSIDDFLSQLDDFVLEIDDIVSDLIKGDKDASFKKFNIFLGKFRDIIQLLKTIETLFSLNYEEIKFNNTNLQTFSEDLIKILTEVKDSLVKEDLVTLSDLLEYEIKEKSTEDLRQALKVLSELLSNG
ncbi:hypothetical protein BVX93_00500 [bacterium B13(2017)]|nr:hypothetical protein BVX93_00500 [bacterium B13(2017)]